jgi:glycine cleavage system H protein
LRKGSFEPVNVPSDLRYSTDHEWVRKLNDGLVRIGITDYAQDALGDVVFVEVVEVGTTVAAGAIFGEVESTKSVSELLAPVSGEVVAANEDLEAAPERVNEDPYGDGWICEMRTESSTTDGLLDASAYLALIEV